MPFPKIKNGRVDPQLTNILLAYTNKDFLADQIMPVVPGLKEESGKIPSMGQDHLRTYSSKRSLYDESEHRINFTINNDKTYQIDYYDISIYVPDRLEDQLQKPFDAKVAAQFTLINSLKLDRDNALATQLTDTTVLTQNTTLSGTSQYSDYDNSTPEDDFDTARDTVFNAIGRDPNAVLMSRKVANYLRKHPWFLEIAHSSLKGGGGLNSLSESAFVETLKSWFQVDYVFIGKSIKITSKKGQSTVTKSTVWGDDVVWFYRAPKPSLFEPSFGYSFQLEGKNLQTRIRRHVNDKGDIVEVLWAFQDNILDTNAAYLIKNAV